MMTSQGLQSPSSRLLDHTEDSRELKKQMGIVRQEEEEEEEKKNTVREWEEGLPSLADLISLSQCLISPQLASAFSITSPSPSVSPTDVANASFSSLRRRTPLAYPDLLRSTGTLQVTSHVDPHPQAHADDPTVHGADSSGRIYNGKPQTEGAGDLRGYGGVISVERHHADRGGVSVREYHGISQQTIIEQFRSSGGAVPLSKCHGNSALPDAELRSYGVGAGALVQKYHDDLKPPKTEGGGDGDGEGEGEDEREGESCAHANAHTCISENSDAAIRADVGGGEAEDADSTPGETAVRTLKRPRLVWTQELHKRFVDAVSHLGVKTAVPKTIMQLMNVEGLTRENVASHLQKYRLYLKRMQGLSNEGSTTSDHLFASTPIPASLVTPGRFYAGLPAHLQDINQVPFTPSHNPISMGTGHVAGIVSGPLPPMDMYSYNMFVRPPPHRFVQGDVKDVKGFRQHHSSSSQHVSR